ncbi:MAG: hypothetical protein ACOYKZ_02055 [Chlamydiia bacterium]
MPTFRRKQRSLRVCLVGLVLCCRLVPAQYFVAGSMLDSPQGMRSVESLQPGDLVYCRTLTGVQDAVPLQSIRSGMLNGFTEIWLEGEPHFLARERQLYSLSRCSFVRTDELCTGEQLAAEDGHTILVDAILVHRDPITVYQPVLSQPKWLATEPLRRVLREQDRPSRAMVDPSTFLQQGLQDGIQLPWQPRLESNGRFAIVLPLLVWGAAEGVAWVSLWTMAGVVATTLAYEATQTTLQCATDWLDIREQRGQPDPEWIGLAGGLVGGLCYGDVFSEQRSPPSRGTYDPPVIFQPPAKSDEHPHGKSVDAEYHTHPRPGKSPAPKNGQEALDNSQPTSGKRRVGISDGEFVVQCPTSAGEWHPHVRPWDGPVGERLTDDMRKALQNAGMADKRGRPQPPEKWHPPLSIS